MIKKISSLIFLIGFLSCNSDKTSSDEINSLAQDSGLISSSTKQNWFKIGEYQIEFLLPEGCTYFERGRIESSNNAEMRIDLEKCWDEKEKSMPIDTFLVLHAHKFFAADGPGETEYMEKPKSVKWIATPNGFNVCCLHASVVQQELKNEEWVTRDHAVKGPVFFIEYPGSAKQPDHARALSFSGDSSLIMEICNSIRFLE